MLVTATSRYTPTKDQKHSTRTRRTRIHFNRGNATRTNNRTSSISKRTIKRRVRRHITSPKYATRNANNSVVNVTSTRRLATNSANMTKRRQSTSNRTSVTRTLARSHTRGRDRSRRKRNRRNVRSARSRNVRRTTYRTNSRTRYRASSTKGSRNRSASHGKSTNAVSSTTRGVATVKIDTRPILNETTLRGVMGVVLIKVVKDGRQDGSNSRRRSRGRGYTSRSSLTTRRSPRRTKKHSALRRALLFYLIFRDSFLLLTNTKVSSTMRSVSRRITSNGGSKSSRRTIHRRRRIAITSTIRRRTTGTKSSRRTLSRSNKTRRKTRTRARNNSSKSRKITRLIPRNGVLLKGTLNANNNRVVLPRSFRRKETNRASGADISARARRGSKRSRVTRPTTGVANSKRVTKAKRSPRFRNGRRRSRRTRPRRKRQGTSINGRKSRAIGNLTTILNDGSTRRSANSHSSSRDQSRRNRNNTRAKRSSIDSLELVTSKLTRNTPRRTTSPTRVLSSSQAVRAVGITMVNSLLFNDNYARVINCKVTQGRLGRNGSRRDSGRGNSTKLRRALTSRFNGVIQFRDSLRFLQGLSPLRGRVPTRLPTPRSTRVEEGMFQS